MKLKNQGFTLVEIMIVVAIIGLLAAIAMPNYVEARRGATRTVCLTSLDRMNDMKEIALLDGVIVSGIDDLIPVYIKADVTCPGGGGDYIIPVGSPPVSIGTITCELHTEFGGGHEEPPGP